MFVNDRGAGIEGQTLRRHFADLIRRCGDLPKVTPHALRQSGATSELARGASVKAVSARLRHADPGFTLRVYAHALPRHDEELARHHAAALDRSD